MALSALDASVPGTAWLTGYLALFTKSELKPGETLLVQGPSGGMSTALIQLGRVAGLRNMGYLPRRERSRTRRKARSTPHFWYE
jgi:NADPH:quinone reductase-like Zn-dependent oxidoreductase